MTIKDRLRDNYKWRHDQEQVVGVCDEAVYEIERLERALAKARSDALEEAANVCDVFEEDVRSSRQHRRGDDYDLGLADGAQNCSINIHALKEKKL